MLMQRVEAGCCPGEGGEEGGEVGEGEEEGGEGGG